MATDRDSHSLAPRRFVQAAAIAASAPWLFTGLVAVFDPRRFYDTFAVFAPYNSHFIRDIGTLEVGLSIAVVLAVLIDDAVLAVLLGFEVFQILHIWSHVLDRNHGGHPASDVALFSLLALLTGVAVVFRWRDARVR